MTITIYCNSCTRSVIEITDIKENGQIVYEQYTDSPELDYWYPLSVIVECPECDAEEVDIHERFDSKEECIKSVVEILRQKYGMTDEI